MSACPHCRSEDFNVEVTAYATVPADVDGGTIKLIDSIGPYIEDRDYGAIICEGCGSTLTPADLT
jgi:predicted nucleic-acid-binding Zn-ribbon protein